MISRKLRSRAGASLIAALFLFLLCAMAGSTILAAATANAGRLANRRQENQAYYKTISAARLFADKFDGKSVTITWKRTLNVLDGTATYSEWRINGKEAATVASGADAFLNFLESAIADIYGSFPDSSVTNPTSQTILENYWINDFSAAQEKSGAREFTVALSGDAFSGLSGLDVYGRIALQSLKGKIRAVFSSADFLPPDAGSGEYKVADGAYLIRLDCEPTVTTAFSSPSPVEYDPLDSTFVTKEEQTKAITFTWSDVKIKEG